MAKQLARRALSELQEAVVEAAINSDSNIAVRSVAGSGKTTVGAACYNELSQIGWNVKVSAFGVKTSEDFRERIGLKSDDKSGRVGTIHSRCLSLLYAINGGSCPTICRGTSKARQMFSNIGCDIMPGMGYLLTVYDRARQYGINPDHETALVDILDISKRFTRVLDEPECELVRDALQCSMENLSSVDYTDMVWLPYVLGLRPSRRCDIMIGDEVQDWSLIQRKMVPRFAHRMIVLGDPNQSIMGFQGADTDSYPSLVEECEMVELPLFESFRCPASHVEAARAFVPDMVSANPTTGKWTDLGAVSGVGVMNLCRTNASCVRGAIASIRQGIKSCVYGTDVGELILDYIADVKGTGVEWKVNLRRKANTQLRKLSEAGASNAAMRRVKDLYEATMAIAQGLKSVPQEIRSTVSSLFIQSPLSGSVATYMTVHKAKGLESGTVAIPRPYEFPLRYEMRSEEEYQQARNVAYVALTRSYDVFSMDGPMGWSAEALEGEDEIPEV